MRKQKFATWYEKRHIRALDEVVVELYEGAENVETFALYLFW